MITPNAQHVYPNTQKKILSKVIRSRNMMAKKSILVFARIVNKTQKSMTKNELHDARKIFDCSEISGSSGYAIVLKRTK